MNTCIEGYVRSPELQKLVDLTEKLEKHEANVFDKGTKYGVLVINEKEIICNYNSYSEEILGYSIEDVLNKPIDTILPRENIGKFSEYLKEDKLGISQRFKIQHKHGFECSVLMTIAEINIGNEKYFVSLICNVTHF